MDKMRRYVMPLFMAAVGFVAYAQAAEVEPVLAQQDPALQQEEGQDLDGATRGCKIGDFTKLTACELFAHDANIDRLRVNQRLVVYGDEEVAGDLIVDGDLIVRGDYVPLTINLTPGTDKITNALNSLSNDVANFGSVLINLAPGTYTETDLNFSTQVQDVTIIGDTHPLAGVGFIQGGIYSGQAYYIQRQLNTQIGIGCNYDIGFDASGTVMTVAADSTVCGGPNPTNPDFSGLVGYTVVFIGTDGTFSEFTVSAVAANTITFTSAVAPTVAGTSVSSGTSLLGVGFVIVPNVSIVGPTGSSSLIGVKNLKLLGIFFNWNVNDGDLYLGGVNTKMELSNCLFDSGSGTVFITANQAYNRQPNTFVGDTRILSTCTPDFIYNTLFDGFLSIESTSGTFAYAQFAGARLRLEDNAHINCDFTRVYNNPVNAGVLISNGSVGSLSGAIVNNADQGVLVQYSSTLTTGFEGTPRPVSITNCATGLFLRLAATGLIQGATNPTNFNMNTNDVVIDGTSYATLGLAPNGIPQALNSYVLLS